MRCPAGLAAIATMNHSFDTAHAAEYGLIEAILISNFQFWITKNQANEMHNYNDRTWTYNSVKALQELFPYVGIKQVRNALANLVELKVLVRDNFNTRGTNHTLWYAFADEIKFIGNPAIRPKGQIDCAERANRLGQKGKTLITTDSKHTDRSSAAKPQREKRASASAVGTFGAWEKQCIADNRLMIPANHSIYDYAELQKLPVSYIEMTWFKFKQRYADSDKKYIDWTRTFANAVKENYYGIWYDKDGHWVLTTKGIQLKNEMKAAR